MDRTGSTAVTAHARIVFEAGEALLPVVFPIASFRVLPFWNWPGCPVHAGATHTVCIFQLCAILPMDSEAARNSGRSASVGSASVAARSRTVTGAGPPPASCAAYFFRTIAHTARAENRRKGRLSTLRAHTNAPYKIDLVWKTLRALKSINRHGQVRTEVDLAGAVVTVEQHVPGVITPAQPGGPVVGNSHQLPCWFNERWVGIVCNRQTKGAGRPPCAMG